MSETGRTSRGPSPPPPAKRLGSWHPCVVKGVASRAVGLKAQNGVARRVRGVKAGCPCGRAGACALACEINVRRAGSAKAGRSTGNYRSGSRELSAMRGGLIWPGRSRPPRRVSG